MAILKPLPRFMKNCVKNTKTRCQTSEMMALILIVIGRCN